MTALTASELAAARAGLATMLPDTATIKRRTDTGDGAGGQATTYPDIAAGVPCKLAPASRQDALKVVGDQVDDETTHRIAFPHGQDIRPGDRAVIGGVTFEILHVRTAGAWELSRHALARQA